MRSYFHTRFAAVALLCTIAVLPACAPSPFAFDPLESRPLLRDLPRHSSPSQPDGKPYNRIQTPTSGELSLRDALAAALIRNPRLHAAAWGPRLEEAKRLQAGLLPNPEVGVEFENFAGSGELSGADSLETTIVLSQLIELGDKRELRVDVAEEAWQVSALDYEAQRLSALVETAARFVRVLEIQQRVAFAERARDLAEENRRVIDQRVKAGDVSPIDEIKARLESESGRITTERLKRELEAARRNLSAMWDEDEPGFTTAVGSLTAIREVPPLKVLSEQVDEHPEVQRWVAESERRSKSVDLAKAQSVRDVTAELGVRYMNDVDDGALVGSISVPLNVFDRNQAGILTARLQAAQALDHARALRRELATRLSREHGRLSAAYHEAKSIEDALLPAARDAYEATHRAYKEGKTAYLGVLDAQRTLFETESQHLAALSEYHAALVQVEGLISSPLPTITTDLLTTPPTKGDTP
jgi:cobalt-zinc-cadmium efflux system outer membrane protein